MDGHQIATMRVRVPIFTCSICGAWSQAKVHAAESRELSGTPEQDADLYARSCSYPDGWWWQSWIDPNQHACPRCKEALRAGSAELIERLRRAAESA